MCGPERAAPGLDWEKGGWSPAAFLKTWAALILSPRVSLKAPAPAGLLKPAAFALIVNLLVLLGFWVIWQLARGAAPGGYELLRPGTVNLAQKSIWLILAVNLAGVAVQGLLTHLVLMGLGGTRQGPKASLRAACYAQAPHPIGLAGVVGLEVFFVWNLWLMTLGLAGGHRTGLGRAAAASIIYLVLTILIKQGLRL